MRKFILSVFFIFLGLYVTLHLILGSSPVQKRVVAELQQLLTDYGLSLEMESIEFSAFAPKIYLNRVNLASTPNSKIPLAEPLSVDKIKIQFRPLALLWGRIVIDELILYHPRIQVPRADKLYKTAMGLFGAKEAIKVERPTYDVVFYKMGVVDALFNIESVDPPLAVRSRSLTVVIEKGSGQQRSALVQSSNLEIVWKKLGLALTNVDVDADFGADSLRLNKGVVETVDFAVNIIGVSRMPTEAEPIPRTLSASYDLKAKLPFLQKFPSLGAPHLQGQVATNGTIKKEGELYSGKGKLQYADVMVDEYEVGSGNFAFALEKRHINISQAVLKYAEGEFRSQKMQIELSEHFPITGEMSYQGLQLEGIMRAVDIKKSPAAMETSGQIKVSGTFRQPFELRAELDSKVQGLFAVDDLKGPKSAENALVHFGNGTLKGPLTFTLDKMDFDAELAILGGKIAGKGFVGFDDTSRLKLVGDGISLTKMARIAELELGGTASVDAEIVVEADEGHVSGSFEVQDATVAALELGTVSGEAFYQADLLTFENLVLPSLEPIRGNGYVDFRGKGTQYKFYVNARRTETNTVFKILRNLNFSFEIPKGGEVSTRVTVEGGEKGAGVSVSASGQGKNFNWFEERWLSSAFNLSYADSTVELTKVILTKPSGALEARGRFGKDDARLQLSTFGLDIGNFERFGTAPVSGEVAGQIVFEGPKGKLFGNGRGDIKLVKAKFRGVPIPDSTVKVKADGDRLEYLFNLGKDRLRGRYVRSPEGRSDELLVYFQDYDFAPLMTLALSRDIPPMSDLRATGDLSMSGDFEDPSSVKGSGTISQLFVGFKGTPMKISSPAQIKMDKSGIRIDSIFLQGEDSQLAVALNFEADRRLEARLDGRIDLQYLQPFIPGLEYGSGKVSTGLRISGHPSRYQLLGNVALEGGTFRLTGFNDEFRAVEARLSLSQDRINVDRFESNVNGGMVVLEGDVRLDRFHTLAPNLRIRADKVVMSFQDYLSGKLSGEFSIRGKGRPYQLAGRCDIHEAALTKFQSTTPSQAQKTEPIFTFDVQCLGAEKLMVATDLMQAEFRGGFHMVGDNINPGLLGSVESIRGSVLFRDNRFNLESASVKFESPNEILPRFRVSARANVREVQNANSGTQNTTGSSAVSDIQNYEINLQAFGTPADYKLRLTSSPTLLESEIISLLVLGVTSKGQQGGNLLDLGSALVGQIPLQSKLKKDLGVNIKISSQPQATMQQGNSLSTGAASTDINAPTVQIQKTITDKTKISYSNTLETIPGREFRIEQMLDENITVNATTMERTKTGQAQPTQTYGLDFRYRFQFE